MKRFQSLGRSLSKDEQKKFWVAMNYHLMTGATSVLVVQVILNVNE